MMSLDDVERDILLRGLKDVIGLWQTEKAVETYHPGLSSDEIRGIAATHIERLLKSGLMLAGDLTSEEFVPWASTPDETVDRIRLEWQSLAGQLTPPDRAWFRLTALGRRAIEESQD